MATKPTATQLVAAPSAVAPAASASTDPNQTLDPTQLADDRPLTAAQAATWVRRPVTRLVEVRDAQGEVTKVPRTEWVPVVAGEVFAWRDYGDRVVVVTIDGQKLSSADLDTVDAAAAVSQAN